MSRVQRTDITITIEEWLNRHFVGQVILWLCDHISEPHFITSLTLWAVKAAARVLEPLLLVCAVYLMVSMGIPSLMRPNLHDFSMSVLTGAPDVILPGGFATVWQKIAKKNYISAGVLTVLLLLMAVLTGIANADIFKVIQMAASDVNKLLFWRSMIGLIYSTTIIITLLTSRHTQESVRLGELQQGVDALHDQLEAEQKQTSNLQEQIEGYIHRATLFQKQLGSAQQEMARLQQDLTNEQGRSSTLQEELEAGQGDATALRKQLNTALVDIDTMRAQLEGKEREVVSLKEALTGSNEMQQSRVQQLLADEQKQVEHLRQQLGAEQEGVLTLRQQLHTTNLQVIDLAAKLEAATRQVEKLQDAEVQVHDLTTKLEQRDKEFAVVQTNLQTANVQIHNLQKRVDETANLPAKLQEKDEELAGLRDELQTAKQQARDLRSAKSQPAKSSDRTANTEKITSIETAKSNRISHAEVIAYMDANPTLKRAEVAANLSISERKVYDAIAWRKDQENAVAEA